MGWRAIEWRGAFLAICVWMRCHAVAAQGTPPPPDLPGDGALPSIDAQLAIPLGPPAGSPAKPLPALPAGTMPLAVALKAASAAEGACRAAGYRVGVAVVDQAGVLRASLATDGAAPGRIYVAIRKSLTTLAFRLPSSQVRALVQADPAQRAKVQPNMALFAGAVPLLAESRLVGAVAVSGSTQNQDESCAAAGAAAVQGELP